MFDAHSNFGYSLVATAPSPANSGTTLSVSAGSGSLFPVVPFNATVFPANAIPLASNAEIIRVTSKGSGDNWTILRTQESSSARSIQVGDQIVNTVTVKVVTDLEGMFPVTEANLSITNVTTGNVSTSAHGFAPIATAPAVNVRTALVIDNAETLPTFKVALDATNPTTIGVSDVASPGTSLIFAHRDHQHGSPAVFPIATPGTLTVSTTNAATAPHTHAITSSSNPGAAASLLASDASGFLQLAGLISPLVRPAANSTTAIQLQNATGTGILNVDSTNKRIGIWSASDTTVPSAALTVIGATPEATVITANRPGTILLFGAGSAYYQARDVTNHIEYIMGTSTANSDVFIGAMTNHALEFRVNNGTVIYISTLFYVGIGTGTVAPTAKLQVTGTADSSQLLVTGFTTQAVATSLIQFSRNDTAAGISAMLGLTALGSGANGDGGSILLNGKSSTTAAQAMGLDQWLWVNATHASRTARRVFNVYDTAAREGFRIEASGTAPMIGFLGANAIAQQANTVALNDLWVNYGLRASGGYSNFSTTIQPRVGTTVANTAPLKFTTQASGLTVVEQGAMELIGNSLQFTQLARRRGVAMTQNTRTTDFTLAASSGSSESAAVETSSHGANYLEVGKLEELVLVGTMSQRSNPNAKITVRVKYAGSTVLTFATATSTVIVANSSVILLIHCTCRSTGNNGTMQINAVLDINGQATDPQAGVLATIDTTIAQDTTVTFQWGTDADAANTITINQARVLCIEPSK